MIDMMMITLMERLKENADIFRVFLWDDNDMWVVPLLCECYCDIGKWWGEYDVVSDDAMQNDKTVLLKCEQTIKFGLANGRVILIMKR